MTRKPVKCDNHAVETAVAISGIRKSYRGLLPWSRRAVQAVAGVDFEIRRGEIFGLLGPNGAGKTTTIKMIAGLIMPDTGSITFPATSRRPRIGAVLEGSRNLYWRLSAWENIHYFGELKGVPLSRLRPQADELLKLFGLYERKHSPAQTLSRGMQQKLAVVLAFLGEPELLLLDEPTLGLDVASSQAIQRLLRQLCHNHGITIVVTTHQMEIAQALCQRVGIMREGKLAACAPVASLVDHFKRQDYLIRVATAAWEKILPALAAFDFDVLPEERSGQVLARFKLADAFAVYPLMRFFEAQRVELLDFQQETPTLESIFLKLTEGETAKEEQR